MYACVAWMHVCYTCACYTYCQAAEEVFDGVLGDVIGQVAQEGRVRRAAGQPGPVHVGLAGRARRCGQGGAVDALLRVPRGRDWSAEGREPINKQRTTAGRPGCLSFTTMKLGGTGPDSSLEEFTAKPPGYLNCGFLIMQEILDLFKSNKIPMNTRYLEMFTVTPLHCGG